MLDTARVGHLGLLGEDGLPRVLPVAYALGEGGIWSAVDAKPKSVAPEDLARVRFLRRRPEVAFTVDVYDDDWSRLAWVQVLGRTEILAAAEAPGALEALARRYEPYRADPPPGPLLRIEPVRCLHWRAAAEDQASSSRRTR